ncbi:phosphate ABC transporter membrane protein 2 (PhoT family) [Plasticicumulans lactativorans]|uniref:Phosphate transport system permease protein PstA n=1 Tax=Plasticicumulans lactativorans TaxID=1133106 RepID=A0A4R2LFU5_9GAMM|nr:phosphate ABC transporter permease PstA [Plasticicumulans lactativorans]TCO83704.1 phosphate ABC transporter membrane protein 2 (PhoT family) [Plasticicumulans lactativorans]
MNKPTTTARGVYTIPEERRIGGKAHLALVTRRNAAERRFRAYGIAALGLSLLFLVTLFVTIIGNGASAFRQTYVKLDVNFAADVLDPDGKRDPATLGSANYLTLVRNTLRSQLPDTEGRAALREAQGLISSAANYQLREMVLADPLLVGQTRPVWVLASALVDATLKGGIDRNLPESDRKISDRQLGWLDKLAAEGRIERRFNSVLFTAGDSREPEQAGIWGAVMGSFYTMVVTLALSFPIGVAAAIYLEEFAPRNRWTDLIEVNINNLAAVPSIVYGLLGLAVFINWFGLPRSAPLVGGLVLTLMTLPVIIIASRAALTSVPPSIREAALGMGASKMQTVTHHVLPLALPGMLTGAIIGMSRALGETAPLLMIGMVAFIVDVPTGFTSHATVLPVQIYLWADSPERAFVERTSAAILVLLGFMVAMNALAVILRKRFERRW